MSKLKNFFKRPLAAGLVGGLVVGILVLVAVGSGLVQSSSSTTTIEESGATPLQTEPAAATGLTAGQIYDRDGGSVAYIQAQEKVQPSSSPFDPMPQQGGTATGSGFVIDNDGHILTNAHVVDGATSVTVKLGQDGEELPAKVVGVDKSTDVAVISVDPSKIDSHPLTLGDSDHLNVGDPVVAIGNPFGLDRTVTAGIISALQREISAPDGFTISNVIQTDAAINPGNSGGPLIDGNGAVIGITSQIATAGGNDGNVGVGFAVPINTAKTVAQQLIDNGSAQHAYIGIKGTDLTSQIADALHLDVDQGALVQSVEKGSPAADAGLQSGDTKVGIDGQQIAADGDVIVEADGQKITSMDDLIAVVNSHQPGDTITLQVDRNGQTRSVSLKLGTRPASAG